ncbi:MAG: putative Ig domain-containing protein [Candidatus Zixiibacteriota bacterium]
MKVIIRFSIFICAILISMSLNLLALDNDINLPFDINDQQARMEYQQNVKVTHWPDNIPGEPLSYEKWKSSVGPEKPFEASSYIMDNANKREDMIPFGIFVNAQLYPNIEAGFIQYISDLMNDGYDVKVHQLSGGQPSDLRSLLISEYNQGMEGCILIGDLPVAWYETNCWDSAYTSFPIDLYYMDMDGVWEDLDSDGMYDSHSGDRGPEIWVGRLTASTLTYTGETEAELINNYFIKNHAYRTGQNFLPNRALVYIDDDWIPNANTWNNNVGLAYPDRTFVYDGATTIKTDYESRLTEGYESILLCCHSWPQGHSFKIGDQWTGGSTYYFDIVDIKPPAHFYNLFACSNGRYTDAEYMVGWYTFYDANGIAAIGCTKTGSMLYFNYFYGPFGNGRTIGQALMDWFTVVDGWGWSQDDLCWFYGMTLIGDPTLKHLELPPLTVESESLTVGQIKTAYCDTLEISGGLPPYSTSISDGALPEGLQLNQTIGEISGTPIHSGLYQFAVTVEDNSQPKQTTSAPLNIQINYLCGDPNDDGMVNILDVVYIIAYLYKGGTAPYNIESADVNNNGIINILDITDIIAYLYKSGEPLNCGGQ